MIESESNSRTAASLISSGALVSPRHKETLTDKLSLLVERSERRNLSSLREKKSEKLSLAWNCMVSGAASCAGEAVSFPFDFAKTRLQVQSMCTKSVPVYAGMIDVLKKVPREQSEGFFGLYRGLGPALLRQATYGTIKVVSYEEFKHGIDRHLPFLPRSGQAVLAAVLAGTVSSGLCTPTDLIKVRMQAGASLHRPYASVWNAGRSIIREEGWTGLYKGTMPTIQRAVVITVLNLASYDIIKGALLSNTTLRDDATTYLVGSLITGLMSTYGSQPIDVIKSRIMAQPVDPRTGRGLLYRSSFHCAQVTVAESGWGGLWKGSVPNLCRTVPWLMTFWVSFETLKAGVLESKM